MDKCGVELSTADRSIGKAYIGKSVKQSGLYSKSDKWNLLLAIYGDPPVEYGRICGWGREPLDFEWSPFLL